MGSKSLPAILPHLFVLYFGVSRATGPPGRNVFGHVFGHASLYRAVPRHAILTVFSARYVWSVLRLAIDAPSRFGVLLRTFRIAAGLTQEGLAERARMSKRGLQDLERGVSQRPRRDTIDLLAEALDLSPSDRAAFLAAAQARLIAPPDAAVAFAPAGLSGGSDGPVVGRERELALLDRFLAAPTGSTAPAPLLLLAGEPGIGKTQLLRIAAQRAAAAGWAVLIGGCLRRLGQEPYAPLVDALARHIQALQPAIRRADLEGCEWLGRLLPGLTPAPELLLPGTLTPDQERRLIYGAVERFLTNVAGPAGTLLILDDLQWAGPDALDLINTLTRGSLAPLRLVAAYRDTEGRAGDPMGVLLADLAHAGLVQRHSLGPLAPAAAAALLDDLLAGVPEDEHGAARRVLERAGGMPFFLVSYAHALRAGATDAVPWDLAQGVRQRLSVLPEPSRQVLDVAAIMGREVPRTLIIAAARLPEEDLLLGLEAACQARLLLETGKAGYVFAHDVIREVAEADIGAARREVLHRRVAEVLERTASEAPPELLAYHFSRGGDPVKAVCYLEKAGDHAWNQRALGAAESHYREALNLLDRQGRAHQAGLVGEKLGEVLSLSGRFDDAARIFDQATAIYRSDGDWEGLVRASVHLGEAQAFRGNPDEGIARLQSLLAELDQNGVPAPASLHVGLGMLMFAVGRYGESLAASARASDLARQSGDNRALVSAAWNRANILQMLGRIEEARAADEALLPLAEAAGDEPCVMAVHRDLAYIFVLRGAFATGLGHMDRSLALAESLGNPANRSFTLAMRGWIAVLRGDWPAAHADLDLVPEAGRAVDRSWYSTYPLIFRARLSLAEADLASATIILGEALALAEASGDLQARRWAATTMAEIDMLESRPAAARDRLVPLLDRPGLEECDVTMFLPVLAWALLELGDLGQAAREVTRALARSRPEGMRLVMVEALWVQTMIAQRQERWDEAADCLEEGIDLARAMKYPAAEARLLQLDAQLQEAVP